MKLEWKAGDGNFLIGGDGIHAECTDWIVRDLLLAAIRLAESDDKCDDEYYNARDAYQDAKSRLEVEDG